MEFHLYECPLPCLQHDAVHSVPLGWALRQRSKEQGARSLALGAWERISDACVSRRSWKHLIALMAPVTLGLSWVIRRQSRAWASFLRVVSLGSRSLATVPQVISLATPVPASLSPRISLKSSVPASVPYGILIESPVPLPVPPMVLAESRAPAAVPQVILLESQAPAAAEPVPALKPVFSRPEPRRTGFPPTEHTDCHGILSRRRAEAQHYFEPATLNL